MLLGLTRPATLHAPPYLEMWVDPTCREALGHGPLPTLGQARVRLTTTTAPTPCTE